MSYAAIDPAIEAWARANSLSLYTSFANHEARYCYKSNAAECFQISIAAPVDGQVCIDLWSVETVNDREVNERWNTDIANFPATLDAALARLHEILAV